MYVVSGFSRTGGRATQTRRQISYVLRAQGAGFSLRRADG